VAGFGERFDALGVLAGSKDAARRIGYLTMVAELVERLVRVTITDAEGTTPRGCPRHAVDALFGLAGAHVDWADSKGLNHWARRALELAEERSKLG
jgi:hypothetical protein